MLRRAGLIFFFTSLVLSLAALLQVPSASAAGGGGGGRGRGRGAGVPDNSNGAVNLAPYAKASTSFVSDNESLEAINDGFNPANSADHTHGAYGNWPQRTPQWVQYEWPKAISTSKMDVFWWADGQGVHLPSACRVSYWDGRQFVPVANAKGLGVLGNGWQLTTFDEVSTTRLRLEINGDGQNSTGIIEWRVYDSGKSPAFPPTPVAGIERSVVIPGKTYLSGSIRGRPSSIAWAKATGPGTVTFADDKSLVTTATFSEPGEYTLKLTASEGDLSNSDTVKVHALVDAVKERLEPVYTTRYSVDSPLWTPRLKVLITNWIPHIVNQLNNPNLAEGGINNFVNAAKKLQGQQAARHVGYPFANAYVYNTLESMCVAEQLQTTDPDILKAQASLKETINQWIPIILAAQEPDGYIQTRFTLNGGNHWDPRTRGEHEGYTAGYFLEAAIADYLMTNGEDKRMYNAARKLADCWTNNIGPANETNPQGQPKKAWFDGHQEMEQALVRFGRFVNDVEPKPTRTTERGPRPGDKYVKLAKFLLDNRQGGSEYDQSQAPVIQQYEAVGHAVRAAYTYSGMADVVMETRDTDYASAVNSLWDDITNRKIYLTGGVGSGETSEGHGKDFSLRNNAYCESCSNCGELFFQYKLNMTYHDAKYVDLYEDTLYNAILGDYDLSGDNFCYTNPLEANGAPAGRGPGQAVRYGWHNCPCCVGNFPRVLLALPTWSYAKGSDGLYVNLFIGGKMTVDKIAGTNVELVQKTDYPYKGDVSITVNPEQAASFPLRIRVPDRGVSKLYAVTPAVEPALGAVSVNGQAIANPKIENGYAVIDRKWNKGDVVSFTVPLQAQRVKADDRVAADRGRVALRFGPLVFNIESADENVDGILPANAPLTAAFDPNLLGGVMTLKSTFSNGAAMTAIPNYARSNRGGRSLVWMHDQ